MWFARLFGGRDDRDDYEEPTAVAPQVQPADPKGPARVASRPSPDTGSGAGSNLAAAKHKGFDPYNSGSFERRNAWERVNRR